VVEEPFIEVRILARTFCIEVEVVGVLLDCCCLTGEGVAVDTLPVVEGTLAVVAWAVIVGGLETTGGAFFFAGC